MLSPQSISVQTLCNLLEFKIKLIVRDYCSWEIINYNVLLYVMKNNIN